MGSLLVLALISYGESISFQPFPSGVRINTEEGYAYVEYLPEEGLLSSEPGYPLLPLVQVVRILPGRQRVTEASASLVFQGEALSEGVPAAAAENLRPVGCPSIGEVRPAEIPVTGDKPIVSTRSGVILGSVTIVTISVNPWNYDPNTGTLKLASSVELEWSCFPAPGAMPALSSAQISVLEERIRALSEARGATPFSPGPAVRSDTEYLLVTGEEFLNELQPLSDHLAESGYSVETVTVESISGSWGGSDVQEDLRNCITDFAFSRGTAYVLLAGDENVVPSRDVYMECEGLVETAPCDLYYADLDGTWDLNGNGVYGEWEDSLDLYADVVLGRILFDTNQEAQAIVDKTLAYHTAGEGDWYRQAVLCGALLFPEIGYTGVKGCELMAGEFPGGFDLVKAYQSENGDYPDTYFPPLHSGSGWNHYAGHGNDRFVIWSGGDPIIGLTRMYGFDNQGRYGIHSSIGCHTGDFTDPGTNLPDTLLTLADGGGVACLFNTTWGWEGYWPEIGPSERLCLNTVSRAYRYKAPTLGAAFTIAKDLEIPNMTGPYDRVMQSVMAYSLFGDPALEVLGVGSSSPVPPLPYEVSILGPNPASDDGISFRVTGISPSYQISVYDIAGRRVIDGITVQNGSASQLELEDLQPGVYFIFARPPGGTGTTGRFVRIR